MIRPRQFADFFVIVITTNLVVMEQPDTRNNRILLPLYLWKLEPNELPTKNAAGPVTLLVNLLTVFVGTLAFLCVRNAEIEEEFEYERAP